MNFSKLSKIDLRWQIRHLMWLLSRFTRNAWLNFRQATGIGKRTLRYTTTDDYEKATALLNERKVDFAIVTRSVDFSNINLEDDDRDYVRNRLEEKARDARWVNVIVAPMWLHHVVEHVANVRTVGYVHQGRGERAVISQSFAMEILVKLTSHCNMVHVD